MKKNETKIEIERSDFSSNYFVIFWVYFNSMFRFTESHRFCNRVQDAYTLRCCPQV